MIDWTHPERMGAIPAFLWPDDPRPAREQFAERYHFGGWHPMKGWSLANVETVGGAVARFPEDPPMRELSRGQLRDETVILFECSWVAVVQPDGTFEISRMD